MVTNDCKIYSLIPLGFEVLEEFDEDKEAAKDLTSELSLTVSVLDNLFELTVVKAIRVEGLSNPVYQYSEPYTFSTVEELKNWVENILPNLEVEFVN